MRWGRLLFEGVMLFGLLLMGFALWVESTRDHSPFLPHFILVPDKDTISVQGTWRREDGDDAWPSQTTTIECERSTRRCIEASAVLAGKDLMMPVSINYLSILRWDDDLIVVQGVGAQCVEEVYEFHLRTKSVTGLQKRKRNDLCDAAPGASASKEPTRLRMIDGYQASWTKRSVRWPTAN
jgi:hypothetical protein